MKLSIKTISSNRAEKGRSDIRLRYHYTSMMTVRCCQFAFCIAQFLAHKLADSIYLQQRDYSNVCQVANIMSGGHMISGRESVDR